MAGTLGNRLKFVVVGPLLEAVNPLIPGHPHEEPIRYRGDRTPSSALELCAGTGYAARMFARAFPTAHVQALDVSRESLALGRARASSEGTPNVKFVEGDAGDLPFPDRSFDLLMWVFGLHELPSHVRQAAAAEAARVLKPGGRFVVVDLDQPHHRIAKAATATYLRIAEPRDARGVLGEGLATMLAEAGFIITSRQPATSWSPIQVVVAESPNVTQVRPETL